MNRLLILLSLLVIPTAAPAQAPAAPADDAAVAEVKMPTDSDDWYAMTLNGQRTGHMRVQTSTEGDATTTSLDLHLAIKRGDQTIEIIQRMNVVEEPVGTLKSAASVMQAGAMSVVKQFTFDYDAGEFTLTTHQFNQRVARTLPMPEGDWLTPAASAVYVEEQIAEGKAKIEYDLFFPGQGDSVTAITHERKGEEDIELFGKTVPAVKWISTNSAMAGEASTDYFDDRGTLLKTRMNVIGMPLEMVKTTKALATLEVDPPELMAQTLIKLDKAIENPRAVTSAKYRIVGVPQDGPSRLSGMDDDGTLTVDLKPVAIEEEVDKTPLLAATSMANFEDPAVKKLVDEVTVKFTSDHANVRMTEQAYKLGLAKYMHEFVRDHITTKDLSVGMATASEVARTGVGDCTEHAVLLAAMLRGAGIPTQTVAGVAYIDEFLGEKGVFGFHMWTRALLPHADDPTKLYWQDMDAALPGDGPFGSDAARIALVYSDMADGEQDPLVDLVPMIGNLEIQVVTTK